MFYLLTAFKPSLWFALAGLFVITSIVYSGINLAANRISQNTLPVEGSLITQGWRQLHSDVWFIVENWLLQGIHFEYTLSYIPPSHSSILNFS